MKSKTLRTITAVAVILIIFIGFFTTVGIGTLSSPGISSISLLCPLGALATLLASKMLIPRAVISFVIMALLIVLFARAFCGWICPVPIVQKLQNLFTKNPKARKKRAAEAAMEEASPEEHDGAKQDLAAPLTAKEKAALTASCSGAAHGSSACSSCAKKRGSALDARHFVLGGALVSTAIFGFPVFCLVCPIGLTFAFVALVIALFANGAVTWTLILIPAILAVELFFFRKWCHQLCPLSAFMSLLAKLNRTFKPTIDDSKCIETSEGKKCGACGLACAEGIDPRHPQLSAAAWSECTKCRDCVDACPSHAISMPLLVRKAAAGKTEASDFVQ